MNRTVKALLSGCLIVIVVGVLLAFAGWRYVAAHKDEWFTKGQAVEAEGRAAGASLDERGCLRSGREKYGVESSIGGRISARLWMKGCLQTSTPGENDLCDVAPQPTAFTDMIRWQADQCSGSDAAVCGDLLQEMVKYCASRERAEKR